MEGPGLVLWVGCSIPYVCMYMGCVFDSIQWNLSVKDTLNTEHFSNEDRVCSTNHIELCTSVPMN